METRRDDVTTASEHAQGELALASTATGPVVISHRTQPRPKPTKANLAGWPWLTPLELDAALKLNSAELVEEIHGLSLRLLLAQDQRESRIDAKAQGLLVTAGLSLTAASTFGGVLLQHPEYLKSVGTNGARVVIWGYAIGLVAGLVASFLALLALFVKKTFRTVDERDALARDALDIAEKEVGAAARTAYRRYVTLHYWQLRNPPPEPRSKRASRHSASPASFPKRGNMGWADGHIARLAQGETVQFRPRGHSMSGKIASGQLCTVAPLHDHVLAIDDIVLCRVKGNQYLHLVKAIQGDRYQIGNNRGGINGWITRRQIFGRLIGVAP